MKFELFKQLYAEALEESDLEYYIAERGWQEWMENYTAQEIADILNRVHTLANNPLKDTRQNSRAEFCREYNIPLRTVEDWDSGNRTPPSYIKLLIDFAQFNR
ncbi:MAG: hypothetical protein Q4B80_01665 [Aerococcaceae bacterium]|nr:hypothetical protein [Aerococcaceae bacterium]